MAGFNWLVSSQISSNQLPKRRGTFSGLRLVLYLEGIRYDRLERTDVPREKERDRNFMTCTGCGSYVAPGVRFCSNCGAQTSDPESTRLARLQARELERGIK